MLHRIVLCGFSEFEHRAMHFSFLHPAEPGSPGYEVVPNLDAADYAVVDADSPSATDGVVQSGRVADAVFIGAHAPRGALSHLQRPIDPTRILRALAELRAAQAMAQPAAGVGAGRKLPMLGHIAMASPAPIPAAAALRAGTVGNVTPLFPEVDPYAAAPVRARSRRDARDDPPDTSPITLIDPLPFDSSGDPDAPITLIDPVSIEDPLPAPASSAPVPWLVVSDPPAPPPVAAPSPDQDVAADLGALIAGDAAPAPADRAPPAQTPVPSVAQAAAQSAKAAARAAARRARLAHEQAQQAAGQQLRDVLVHDPDADASALLCDLLQRFGFAVHAVRSLEAATMALAERHFAAVFLDTALEGAGLEMVQRILKPPLEPGLNAPAVVLVREKLVPTDRVRAALAGIGEPLAKPVSRGGVARALESLGVALPGDARRI